MPLDDVFANHTAEPELPQEAPEIEAEVAKAPEQDLKCMVECKTHRTRR